MDRRERNELDRHITGNYGEDSMQDAGETERLVEAAIMMDSIIYGWRESGKAPNFGDITVAYDELHAAILPFIK